MNLSGRHILALRETLRSRLERVVLPIPRGPLRGMRWIVGSGELRQWLGLYELDSIRHIRSWLKRGEVFIDVGAHVGWYTLFASKQLGKDGLVVAVEPDPRNAFFLKRHCSVNHCQNVVVVEAAASSRDDLGYLETTSSGTHMGSHLSDRGNIRVSLIRIDGLVEKIRPKRVAVVKIDAEGEEINTLEGASGIFESDRPILLLSTHGRKQREYCCEWLSGRGYRVTVLEQINNASRLGCHLYDELAQVLATPNAPYT